MPGRGSALERAYTADERAALDGALPLLGATTFDVYLNEPRLLAQRPRRGLELPAGRLPGAQEVAVVSGAGCARAGAVRGGSAALHGHGAADCGATAAGGGEVSGV